MNGCRVSTVGAEQRIGFAPGLFGMTGYCQIAGARCWNDSYDTLLSVKLKFHRRWTGVRTRASDSAGFFLNNHHCGPKRPGDCLRKRYASNRNFFPNPSLPAVAAAV
jgi:hypothetical protein